MVIYSRYNKSRKPEFSLITSKELINGKLFIYKQTQNPLAEKFLQSFEEKYKKIKSATNDNRWETLKPEYRDSKVYFEYVDGDTLMDEIIRSAREGNFAETFNNYTSDLYSDLQFVKPTQIKKQQTQISKILGDSLFEYNDWISPANIDLTFANVIKRKSKYVVFDYEWLFDFPIPLDYLKFRNAFALYFALNELNLYSEEIHSLLMPYLNQDFLEAERAFQNFVNKKQNLNKSDIKAFEFKKQLPGDFINELKSRSGQLALAQERAELLSKDLEKLQAEVRSLNERVSTMEPDYKEFQSFKKGKLWKALSKYRSVKGKI